MASFEWGAEAVIGRVSKDRGTMEAVSIGRGEAAVALLLELEK
jgi:hypothetical protein